MSCTRLCSITAHVGFIRDEQHSSDDAQTVEVNNQAASSASTLLRRCAAVLRCYAFAVHETIQHAIRTVLDTWKSEIEPSSC